MAALRSAIILVFLLGPSLLCLRADAPQEDLSWPVVAEAIKTAYRRADSFYRSEGISLRYHWSQSYGDEEFQRDAVILLDGSKELNQTNDSKTGYSQLTARNDDYSFCLRKEGGAAWILSDLDFDPERMSGQENNHLGLLPLTCDLYRGYVMEDRLSDIISDQSFTLKDLQSSDDGQRVTFEFESDYPVSDFVSLFHGTVELIRPGWVIGHCEFQTRSPVDAADPASDIITETADIRYNFVDDIPFPKEVDRVIIRRVDSDESVCTYSARYEIPQVGRPSPKAFQLTGYGITEPALPKVPSRTHRALSIAVGLLLFAAGVLLRKRTLKSSPAEERSLKDE